MLNFRILIEESHFFARFSPLISICELLFALLSHCHYIIKGKLTCPTPSLPNSPLFFSFSFWPGLVFVLFAPDCAATRTATPPAAPTASCRIATVDKSLFKGALKTSFEQDLVFFSTHFFTVMHLAVLGAHIDGLSQSIFNTFNPLTTTNNATPATR